MDEDVVTLNDRLRALEMRVTRIPQIGGGLVADTTNGCSNGSCTNGCTNCIADELMNVLLPGQDRALSGREIVKMLAVAREHM